MSAGAGKFQGSWVKPFVLDFAADVLDPNSDLHIGDLVDGVERTERGDAGSHASSAKGEAYPSQYVAMGEAACLRSMSRNAI